ncbi:hypothetical protein Q8A73_017438 [Channa argus]|nr:hypothetical protein Q8A73_017438 [Channa argus]
MVPLYRPWWMEMDIIVLGTVGCASLIFLLSAIIICYKAIKRKPLRKEENGTSRGEYAMSIRNKKSMDVPLDGNANGHSEQFKHSCIVQARRCGFQCHKSNVTALGEGNRDCHCLNKLYEALKRACKVSLKMTFTFFEGPLTPSLPERRLVSVNYPQHLQLPAHQVSTPIWSSRRRQAGRGGESSGYLWDTDYISRC